MIEQREEILEKLEAVYDIERECFDVLTTKQARYLLYRTDHPEIEFMTFEEIGEYNNTSRQSIEQCLSRGLKTLSKQDCFQKRRKL